jgi:DNA-binding IclR family transcriptional regulator
MGMGSERMAPAGGDPQASAPTSLIGRVMRTFEMLSVDPLTAAEVARRLDVNRSTALRLLTELIDTGYVARDPDTKRFATVPSRFLNLVGRPDKASDWSQMIEPVLAEIRDETGDSTMLGVPAGHTMVYLAFFPTFHVVAVKEQLGASRPMHCSGLGKAYLSALDDEQLDQELSRLTYVGGTKHASHDGPELRRRVLQAREDGYALDLEETYEGVSCVAAPLTIGGSLIGAVGVTGPSMRMSAPRLRELGSYLQEKLSSLE